MIEKAIQLAQEIEEIPADKLSSEQLKKIISLIDYTSLNDDDSEESIRNWMDQSIALMKSADVNFGGWCTYSEFSPILREKRNNLPIAIAAVCGNFPSGKALTELKIEEAVLCESLGAEEIDVVINKAWAKEHVYHKIEKELALIKGSLGNAHLKVILETGMLTYEEIEGASKAALRAGADFIKTSTGKTSKGASLEAVSIMCFAIKEHYAMTRKKVGIKPSGGIALAEEAWTYVQLVKVILGEEWLNNKLFRIGASRLLTNAIDQLMRQSSK